MAMSVCPIGPHEARNTRDDQYCDKSGKIGSYKPSQLSSGYAIQLQFTRLHIDKALICLGKLIMGVMERIGLITKCSLADNIKCDFTH